MIAPGTYAKTCPSAPEMSAFIRRLPSREPATEAMARHIGRCEACQERIEIYDAGILVWPVAGRTGPVSAVVF